MVFANVVANMQHFRERLSYFWQRAMQSLTIILSLTIPFSQVSNYLSNTSMFRQTRYAGLAFSPNVGFIPNVPELYTPLFNYNVVVHSTNVKEVSYWDWTEPRYSLCLQPMRSFVKKYTLEQDQYIMITRPSDPYSKYIVRYRYPTILNRDYELIYNMGRCVDVFLHAYNNTLLKFLCHTNDAWCDKEMNVVLLEVHYAYIVVQIDNLTNKNEHCARYAN